MLSILDKEALLSLVHGFNGGILTCTMECKPLGWQGAGSFPRSYCRINFVSFLLLFWVWGLVMFLRGFLVTFALVVPKLLRAEAVAPCQMSGSSPVMEPGAGSYQTSVSSRHHGLSGQWCASLKTSVPRNRLNQHSPLLSVLQGYHYHLSMRH